jgi:hypothetical protein
LLVRFLHGQSTIRNTRRNATRYLDCTREAFRCTSQAGAGPRPAATSTAPSARSPGADRRDLEHADSMPRHIHCSSPRRVCRKWPIRVTFSAAPHNETTATYGPPGCDLLSW